MASPAPFTTDKLILPTAVVNDMIQKVQSTSVVAALATSTPQQFLDVEHLIFTDDPVAEYVGESEEKSSTKFGLTSKTAKPHKIQCTVRFTDEVRWADEDSQLYVLNELGSAMGQAMGEAVDAGIIHAANPYTKSVMQDVKNESISYTGNQISTTGDILKDLDSLPDTIIANKYRPTGVAFDLMYANEMRKLRNKNTDAKLFPDLNLALQPSNYEGLQASVSDLVSGDKFVKSPTGIKAIMGAWNLLKWGYVRQFGLQEILYGDPDGKGDLQRKNEVAFRMEAVIAWVILDPKGFAVLRDGAATALLDEEPETKTK